LVDENSTPINFTIEVVTTEKAGATPKAEGMYYNSTYNYEIMVKGQYVDKTIEEFKYCCLTQGSQGEAKLLITPDKQWLIISENK